LTELAMNVEDRHQWTGERSFMMQPTLAVRTAEGKGGLCTMKKSNLVGS